MSRALLLSDIHGNLAALQAALSDAEKQGAPDEVWSLGDTVGYGPQPNECLRVLRDLGALMVAGNHEMAALGQLSLDYFNPYARAAAEWTINELAEEMRAVVSSLPEQAVAGDFTLVHGSPRNPVWEYVTDEGIARANVDYIETPNFVNGHTHVPAVFSLSEEDPVSEWPRHGQVLDIGTGRWAVNPGSIGQPRDGDRRASYAVLDTDAAEVQFFRVEYAVDRTQHLMEEAGLPVLLIERLAVGR